MSTLKQRLEQEFKGLEFDNHCSDLYVKYNPTVLDWIKKNYEDSPSIVSVFNSQIDSKLWIEVAFAYQEYYSN